MAAEGAQASSAPMPAMGRSSSAAVHAAGGSAVASHAAAASHAAVAAVPGATPATSATPASFASTAAVHAQPAPSKAPAALSQPAQRLRVMATITAVALAVALLALLYGVVTQSRAHMAVTNATQGAVPVLVSLADISAGEVLSEANVTVVEVPAAYRAKDAISESALASVLGKVALSDVSQGAQLSASMVSGFSGGHLAAQITPGMEGVTLSVDEESGLAGQIHAYDQVRIFAVNSDASSEVAAETICEHAKVVSTGVGEGAATGTTYSAITVEVSPEQADQIRVAQYAGSVSVGLVAEQDALVSAGSASTDTLASVDPASANPLASTDSVTSSSEEGFTLGEAGLDG